MKKIKIFVSLCLITVLTSSLFSTATLADSLASSSEYMAPYGATAEFDLNVQNDDAIEDFISAEVLEMPEPFSVEDFIHTEYFASMDLESRREFESKLEAFTSEVSGRAEQGADYDYPLVFDFSYEIVWDVMPDVELESYYDSNIYQESMQELNGIEEIDVFDMQQVQPLDVFAADLRVLNLRTTGRPPLTFGTRYDFTFLIQNLGRANAANTVVRLYLGLGHIGTINLGTIPANAQGNVNFSFGLSVGDQGGPRMLTARASTTTHDINPNLSYTASIIEWQPTVQFIDLAVHDLSNRTSGSQPFRVGDTQTFQVVIVNWGNIASDAPIFTVLVNGGSIGLTNVNLPRLPAGHGVNFPFAITTNRSGNFDFTASTRDRNRRDIDYRNNELSRRFVSIPDGCGYNWRRFGGDANNITLNLKYPDLNANNMQTWARQWNGIVDGVRITNVSHNLNNATTYVVVAEMTEDNYFYRPGRRYLFGYFQPLNSNILGRHRNGRIWLNERYWYNTPPTLQPNFHRGLVIHEVGHLLGLGHPHDWRDGGNTDCIDYAVMQSPVLDQNNRVQRGLWATNVTEHDREALRRRFR